MNTKLHQNFKYSIKIVISYNYALQTLYAYTFSTFMIMLEIIRPHKLQLNLK